MEENGLGPTSNTFASRNLGNDFVIWVTKKLQFYITSGSLSKSQRLWMGKEKRFTLLKEAILISSSGCELFKLMSLASPALSESNGAKQTFCIQVKK